VWDAPRFVRKRRAIPAQVDEQALFLTHDESHTTP
jgi:hypothetical protein